MLTNNGRHHKLDLAVIKTVRVFTDIILLVTDTDQITNIWLITYITRWESTLYIKKYVSSQWVQWLVPVFTCLLCTGMIFSYLTDFNNFPQFSSENCFPKIFLLYVKSGNSYIIALCIFLKGIFLRNALKKKAIKIRWKINSPYKNNRNIYFCTIGPLVGNDTFITDLSRYVSDCTVYTTANILR
jgi:hypothetical protein